MVTKRQSEIRIGNPPVKLQKRFANPIRTALRYRKTLDADPDLRQSELASQVGLSRARVTQLLNLLKLHPDILVYLAETEDGDARLVGVTERKLRDLVGLPREKQRPAFWDILR